MCICHVANNKLIYLYLFIYLLRPLAASISSLHKNCNKGSAGDDSEAQKLDAANVPRSATFALKCLCASAARSSAEHHPNTALSFRVHTTVRVPPLSCSFVPAGNTRVSEILCSMYVDVHGGRPKSELGSTTLILRTSVTSLSLFSLFILFIHTVAFSQA